MKAAELENLIKAASQDALFALKVGHTILYLAIQLTSLSGAYKRSIRIGAEVDQQQHRNKQSRNQPIQSLLYPPDRITQQQQHQRHRILYHHQRQQLYHQYQMTHRQHRLTHPRHFILQ